jgi:hypothetical protein
MKRKFTRNLYLLCYVLLLTTGFTATANTVDFIDPQALPPTNNITTEWQEYLNKDGVLIEYRMEAVYSRDYGREVNMLFFRFTNTTNEIKDCSWSLQIERDNKCYNCDENQNYENIFNLLLNPKETNEGDLSNLTTRPELHVFGHFVKLVPGMTDDKLTGFEFINLTIK